MFSFYGFSQITGCEFWYEDAAALHNLLPHERALYLDNLPTDCEIVHNNYSNRSLRYSENRNQWEINVSKKGFPHPISGNSWSKDYSGTFTRYYKDVDNDGFADDPNDYIYIANAIYDNSGITGPYGSIIRFDTEYINDDIYLSSFFHNYTIANPNGSTTEFTSNQKVYFYNGYHWVKQLYGFDCDNTNPNIPGTIERIYPDYDEDGFGSSEDIPFYPQDNIMVFDHKYKVTGCSYTYPYGISYSYNNDDCNDLEASVTTQSINWYLDSDGDGYGNILMVINDCKRPDGYVDNPNDCNDNDSRYNVEQITWYADFDNDGFGDPNNTVVASCQPQDYITGCYFDDCPTEAGTRTNGCPMINYDFDNENKNYTYERVYLDEYTISELENVSNEDVIEHITYFDGVGRAIQERSIATSPLGKDIVVYHEFDGNGQATKSYLPYVSTESSGVFEEDALSNILSYYNTENYEFTTNPYSETVTEASPLNKVLEQGAPGEDWKVNINSDADHTVKYNYEYNMADDIKKFTVTHPNDYVEHTQLSFERYYYVNELKKVVTKNENWQPNQQFLKDNTTEIYTDKLGHTVLSRAYNENRVHDTYYVYDDLGNLTYVLPPKASDEILEYGEQGFRVASQTNYSWVSLVNVDKEFAEEYNKKLSEYDNQDILNLDLENKYGGQGGFSITTFDDSELVILNLNFSAIQDFELKKGRLIDLKQYGIFKDTELGRISGSDYNYVFFIKDNAINISGEGKLNEFDEILNSAVKLSYSEDYLWTNYTDVDDKFASYHEAEVEQIAKETGTNILDINIENDYGGQGGLNITIDTDDNIALTFNSSTTSPLKLKTGNILSLNTKRRLSNRFLGTISGPNFNYSFNLIDNTISVDGSGVVTLFNGYTFSPEPPEDPVIVPETVEGLCYIYHYDYKNRLIEKKIPGKGWEHIVYDNLDRPALTQHANMKLNNEWLFIKYDQLDRPVYSGIHTYTPTGSDDNSARLELQDIMESQNLYDENKTETIQYINTTAINYTNLVYPVDELEIHSINYYDDYEHLDFNDTRLVKQEGDIVYDKQISMQTDRLPTVGKVRTLSTNKWTTVVIYYDDDSLPIYTVGKNDYLNTVDVVESDFDFSGKILETTKNHTKRFANCSEPTEEDPFPICSEYFQTIESVDYFSYDRVGRLLTQTQTINGSNPELLMNLEYNELGKVTSKKVGGIAATIPENSLGLQSIDYKYNIRGWLKSINNGMTDNGDLFGLKLNYNTPEHDNVNPLYNGNISELHWQTANDNNPRSYDYTFDGLNRLVTANYHGNYNLSDESEDTENYSVDNIQYDKNGNIITLRRYGFEIGSNGSFIPNTDIIDNLVYNYVPLSNTLLAVTDTADSDTGNGISYGFSDNNTTGNDYAYDANGNMVEDKNKNIISIEYNHLNLPIKITVLSDNEQEQTIAYVYNALGQKQKKIITDGSDSNNTLIDETEYAGSYIYARSGGAMGNPLPSNVQLKYFAHSEGYVQPDSQGGFKYVYQYKDHLGNIRLTYVDNNGTLEIIEENNYYPFGLKHKGYNGVIGANNNEVASKFKFNGIELEKAFGLNLYEMPFRQYDPAIARWTSIDPITHHSFSPYSAFDNNPVFWADPSGADAEYEDPPTGNGEYDGQLYFDDDDYGWVYSWDEGSQKWLDMGGLRAVLVSSEPTDSKWHDEMEEFDEDWEFNVDWDDPAIQDASTLDVSKEVNTHKLSQNLRKISGYALAVQKPLEEAFKSGTKYPSQNYPAHRSIVSYDKKVLGKRIKIPLGNYNTQTLGTISKTLKVAGKTIGGFGVVSGGVDMYNNGVNWSNGLDTSMSLLALSPTGVGQAIAGTYFVFNSLSQLITGKDIGQHIQSAIDGN